ncbi:nucleotidyltransferase family protein [Clostridium sp.]|jgi:hypothetical protein|uniref:nucleotidyltransferase domain-containing protein n=1 Tax=Clostridium sp. TaxID=1506 RepID=UPI002586C592|nr:nucleotidyltransferase family protein [Clostridium sp.]MDF2505649.1 hypothetical protein [Clostridium sp.]
MDNNQRQLLDCISAAIHGDKITIPSDNNLNWTKIIEQAYSHNVEALLYSSLGKIKEFNEKLFDDIKKNTIITALQQINHVRQLEKVFKEFNDNNVVVVGLKGIVVRELYARPEFRTMSDSDLLVHKDDLKRGKQLLLKLGYIYNGCEKNHLSFKHEKFLPLDLHWTLEDKREKGVTDFDNKVWKNIIEIPIGKEKGLSLSWEDTLVHLLMHMAGHTVNNGFGIRQLCDVVLVIEKKGNMIDWRSFHEKIRSIGIEKFTIAVFITCRELFKIKVPSEITKNMEFTPKYLNIFINYMYSCGAQGRFDLVNVYSNQLAYNPHNNEVNESNHSKQSIIKRMMKILFPGTQEIKNRFPYTKKFIILFPLAWCLYIGGYIIKFKSFMISVPISRRRYELFKYLDL